MTRLLRAFLVCVALMVPAAVFLGCEDAAPAASGEAVSWVNGVRDAHTRADAAEARSDWESARDALRPLVTDAVPTNVAAVHARAIQQDARYRLASVAMRASQPAEAEREANAGIALGVQDDVMSANLFVIRGEAREAMGRAADAAADYHRAVMINESLLETVLGEDGDAQ